MMVPLYGLAFFAFIDARPPRNCDVKQTSLLDPTITGTPTGMCDSRGCSAAICGTASENYHNSLVPKMLLALAGVPLCARHALRGQHSDNCISKLEKLVNDNLVVPKAAWVSRTTAAVSVHGSSVLQREDGGVLLVTTALERQLVTYSPKDCRRGKARRPGLMDGVWHLRDLSVQVRDHRL
jgi:hypothetical protein